MALAGCRGMPAPVLCWQGAGYLAVPGDAGHLGTEQAVLSCPALVGARGQGLGCGRQGQSLVHRGLTQFPLPIWPDLSSPRGLRSPAMPGAAPALFPALSHEQESRIWSASTSRESWRGCAATGMSQALPLPPAGISRVFGRSTPSCQDNLWCDLSKNPVPAQPPSLPA